MTMSFGPDNPFYEGFETDPVGQRANYFSFQNQFGRSPNQRKYFEDRFADVQNQFMGRLGQTVRGGGQPSQSWTDFLSEYFSPQGGASADWMNQGQRRQGATRFNPPTQFNYGTQRPGL